MQRPPEQQVNEKGFSLIETLIVMTVLAISILPLVSTQFNSRRAITEADRETQAMQIAVEQVEMARMRGFGSAIQDSIQDGNYEVLVEVVPDTLNPFLEEVRVIVNWETGSGTKSMALASKRAGR
ncbi:hypothetical protein DRQ53_02795 [bacterium]|nr:MAG: hypothetical protein DRQ32_09165 [bacterium]RKZ17656.1 MAG: hypothetical protein DRQ53_02795 [bacterium]